MSEQTSRWSQQLEAIADLMLGVAYADGHFDPQEADVIRKSLALFERIDGLSAVVQARLEHFAPSSFDIDEAVASIRFHGRSDRLMLLELVRDVLDADAVRDERETTYFRKVADALGVSDAAEQILAPPPDPSADPYDA